MAKQAAKSIIHRKARVGREDFDARAMSPAKALRLSLTKAADKVLGLAVTVSTVQQTALPQAGLREELSEPGLLVLLDGQGGRRGAMHLEIQMLSALIEVQTTGAVGPGEAPERPVTPTDAAMTAPVIDAMTGYFDEYLDNATEDHVARAWRFADRVEDARTLALSLEAPDYDLFRITAELGEAAKTGELRVILPREPEPSRAGANGSEAEPSSSLRANALNAPAMLDAVLARLSLPLKEVCAFAPGIRLRIPAEALAETQLLAAGQHVVTAAKLGQVHGWRAVRLLGPPAKPAVPRGSDEGEAGEAQRGAAPGADRPAPTVPERASETDRPDRPADDPPELAGPSAPDTGAPKTSTKSEKPPAVTP